MRGSFGGFAGCCNSELLFTSWVHSRGGASTLVLGWIECPENTLCSPFWPSITTMIICSSAVSAQNG